MREMLNPRLGSRVLPVLVALVLAGCQPGAPQASPPAASGPTQPPVLPVRAAYTEMTENRIQLWVGVDHQVFDQWGSHVDATFIASTPTALAALLAGEVDVLEASAGDLISSINRGANLKVIGVVGETTGYLLWVRPEINTPADLAGKRIAISKLGSNSYLFVKSMLEAMHAPEDVTLVPSGDFNANFAAFLAGSVDGYATTPVNRIGQDPNTAHPLGDPAALGVTASGHFLVVRSDYLQSHRDTLVAFLKGYSVATGETYARDDWAKQSFATNLRRDDPVFLQGLVDTYVHYPAGEGGMPIDPTPTLDLMKKQIGVQAKLDPSISPETMDAAGIVDASLMDEVRASPAWQAAWPNGLPQE